MLSCDEYVTATRVLQRQLHARGRAVTHIFLATDDDAAVACFQVPYLQADLG